MGKPSTKAKDKYNSKAYDRLAVRVKKGNGEIIKRYAEHKGLSLNSYITGLIYADMDKPENDDFFFELEKEMQEKN